jgi:hypothetical protein
MILDWDNRWYAEYHQWKSKRQKCNPTIDQHREQLMSWWNEFMNKEKIKRECDCKSAGVCQAICDLLLNHKIIEAEDSLQFTK